MSVRGNKKANIEQTISLKEELNKKVIELKSIADKLKDNSDEQYNLYIAINLINKVGENLWI